MPRLEQLLVRNTPYSRAEARQLLRWGAVSGKDGAAIDERLEPAALPMTVRIREQEYVLHDSSHVLLNKPLGCVTALKDKQHPVAYDFLRGAVLKNELRPIGRLDLDTSGLLLWTTDGFWLQQLSHPKRQVPRTYHAALARPFVEPPDGFALTDGHRPHITELREIDGSVAHRSLARPEGAMLFASITITGGAYHEVRRIFAALGSHVTALCRVSFGNLVLPEDMALGEHRSVQLSDVLSK
jgi:16S rRNA pseudouridine516 synthase